jgi:hypothetical protein
VAQRLTHQVGLPICKGSVHLPACAHGVQAVYALQTAQPGFKLRRDGCAHVKVMIRLYYVRPSIYLDAGRDAAGKVNPEIEHVGLTRPAGVTRADFDHDGWLGSAL